MTPPVTISLSRLFDIQTSARRVPPIEGLRGFSAMLVFFVHFHTIFGSLVSATPLFLISRFLFNLGHCGVDVFFALSGFVIYGPLVSRPVPYLGFIRRRIVRLYPVYTAVFAAYLVASALAPSYSKLPAALPERARFLLSSFLMLPGILPIPPLITVAWSLSYELFFYLSLPLVIRLLRMSLWPRHARVAFWGCACLAFFLACFSVSFPHPRILMFGCGILLWEVGAARTSVSRLSQWLAAAAFLSALSLAGSRSSATFTAPTSALVPWAAAVLPLLFLGTFAVVRAAIAGSGFLGRLFSLNGLRYFGNFSYSYYLIHGAVLLGCREVYRALDLPSRLSSTAFLLLALAAFAATTVAAAVLFLAVERPLSLSSPAQARRPSIAA